MHELYTSYIDVATHQIIHISDLHIFLLHRQLNLILISKRTIWHDRLTGTRISVKMFYKETKILVLFRKRSYPFFNPRLLFVLQRETSSRIPEHPLDVYCQ